MTVVEVIDGSCGFRTRIVVRMENSAIVRLTVSSECDAVARWGLGVDLVEWRECLGKRPFESHLWRSAMETLPHRSCPVLTAVLRAIETEIGATKPAEVAIRFLPA